MRMWVSGYRSYELGVFKDNDPKIQVIHYALRTFFIEQIDLGLEWVITGGQLGIEQWAIQVVQELKADYPGLKIAMILPFADFGGNWQPAKQATLAQLKSQVDFFGTVSNQKYQNPSQLQQYQDFLLGHTDQAALVYDAEFEGKTQYDYQKILAYQAKHPYPLQLLDMDNLQAAALDLQEQRENNLD
ncbi:DUF1273 domain-containing protein [Convivina praedatoris]|uniref:Uncharacterized protein n=1 Tax=Convivina praedatoris TaxID=2880963 RepID=A0ABM9CZQ8_9LACO|nr:DUF1273 domain-containing protein [Convivina sp. LMG 32447]CAH1850057.1 hypothetical protein R077815_00055 [Convivina sp. LMG 32447]CAH1850068.1 hypothetical protein LMG032447_00057 [Convivina sp. LMG 32447]CAH1851144.1 hypothetical protein R078138_00275 [Convivina sp. LMG 32447]